MCNILRARKNNHTPSSIGTPTLSAAQQTRASWAKFIDSYTAIPDAYKDFFEPFGAAGQVFPYTVLIPSNAGFIHRVNEKLICDFGHEVHILEKNGNTFSVQSYPIDRINYVEVRDVLLDSCITINGMTKHHTLASSTVQFNSVNDYLFRPILEKIRLKGSDSKDPLQSSELDKFDHLVNVNHKFMNYARLSLLGGAKVIHSVLQPEIRVGRLRFLGKIFYRIISPTHMSILTDRELIIIREERQPGGSRYGGTWIYIPLEKIIKLSVREQDENRLALSIQLPEGIGLEDLFEISAKQEINQFIDRFRELTTIP